VRGGEHGIESGLLVGAKLHGDFVCVNVLWHKKAGSASPLPISITYVIVKVYLFIESVGTGIPPSVGT
jgi:hypothetical protein